MKLKRVLHIVIFLTSFLACSEDIEVSDDSEAGTLVVVGSINTDSVSHQITIRRSTGFVSTDNYPRVSAARVFVEDDLGRRFEFVEDGSTGNYLSDTENFIAQAGRSYQLDILLRDGRQLLSSIEPLIILPKIDSVFVVEINDQGSLLLNNERTDKYLAGIVNDSAGVRNFYRWRIYVNGQLRNEPEDIVLFDDLFTDGNSFRFDAAGTLFQEGDIVSLEHLSLSESAYEYFRFAKELTEGAESTITQPFSLVGNIRAVDSDEVILGFFWASDVQFISVDDVVN